MTNNLHIGITIWNYAILDIVAIPISCLPQFQIFIFGKTEVGMMMLVVGKQPKVQISFSQENNKIFLYAG